MKTYFSIILFVMISGSVHSGTKKANRLYDRWEYYRASQLYEREVKNNPDPDVYYKLGMCYVKMHKYRDAQTAFDKVEGYGTYHNPEFYLHYGRILNNNERFTEAAIAFDKYTAMNREDMTGEYLKSAMEIVREDHKWDEPIQLVNLPMNSKKSDFCPVIYGNGVVFASSRKTPGHTLVDPWTGENYLDLYYAEKGSSGIDFAGAAPFGGSNINQKYHDGPATFSADFNTMYFTRVERTFKGKAKLKQHIEQNKIYKSEFMNGEWSEAESFAYNSDEYSVAHPFLTADGNRLYFASNMAGGYGESDIYYCKREGAEWGKPVNLGPDINTYGTEKFPFIDEEGNIFFASDGHPGFGGLDICVALRYEDQFAPAKALKAPFNSTTDDFGLALYGNGRSGFFSSDRFREGYSDDDIYSFDLTNDDVDNNLMLRDYTIGYRPSLPPIVISNLDPLVVSLNATPQFGPSIQGNLYFDFGKSELRPETKRTLDTLANFMLANPEKTLVIAAHSDARGSIEYNKRLSEQRNTAVINYLATRGITSTRIRATSYGMTRPINGCTNAIPCNEDQHQLNRRVEYVIE